MSNTSPTTLALHNWQKGSLLERYKRFLATIQLEENQQIITAHCPNTGAMRDLLTPGSTVYVSHTISQTRKTPYTWESVMAGDTMVGVNTHRPNKLIHEALLKKKLSPFCDYDHVASEKMIAPHTRVDFKLSCPQKTCLVEVKNVHYREGDTALFPDSPTTRGAKHLEVLTHLAQQGQRCALIYVVQRDDCKNFDFCHHFDPNYARLAEKALSAGVEMYAYDFVLSSTSIALKGSLPFKGRMS
ncbi:DNA/RNA nuclease SfsA [Candidatus Hepatobacter penaei]|uniref:DNA/RNA nuclease SfsA n=1 Tax=Candidatus Hepatobacter penaei TaxID=1274402 RepID=UPI0006965E4B|nr:DNA/RNA nuclease SfsA [Candidatus Hepatobacter penaei]TGW14939.1 DNA/RNA nuclease SfsA [bacterium NHP-B]